MRNFLGLLCILTDMNTTDQFRTVSHADLVQHREWWVVVLATRLGRDPLMGCESVLATSTTVRREASSWPLFAPVRVHRLILVLAVVKIQRLLRCY